MNQEGDIISAACCRLAIDDVHGAVNDLVSGCEFEIATMLSYCLLGKDNPVTHFAAKFLVLKLEGLGQHRYAAALLACIGKSFIYSDV